MTANQKRAAVVDAYSIILGRNLYSQDAVKRECCFTKYKDGKYYSDCSSSIRLAYKRANIGVSNVGGNTVGMYQNKALRTVSCAIKSGVPTDASKLRVGDMLLFAGNDNSRAYADFVGHVEMIYKIVGNTVTLCGHGSGNPRTIEMVKYCKSRQATKAENTSKGNRGLLKVVRAIPDDGAALDPSPTPPSTSGHALGDRTLKKGVSGPDVKALQTLLSSWGYDCGATGADGDFGKSTHGAVIAWQRDHNLAPDGIVGPRSFEVLNRLTAVRVSVKIVGGDCHIRTGPGTEHASIGTAKAGTILPSSGTAVNGWLGVLHIGVEAWVSAKYSEVI